MGVEPGSINIEVQRRGFYPMGGGEVVVTTKSIHHLSSLQLLERGEAESVQVVVFARGTARSCAKDVAENTRLLLLGSAAFCNAKVTVEIDVEDAVPKEEAIVAPAEASFEEGCGALTKKERRALHLERQALNFGAVGVQLVAIGSLGGVISADSIALEDFPSAAADAVKVLEEQWAAGGAVDEHLMDQLIIYMAMAVGSSSVLCSGRTSISSLHLETATTLITQITGVEFNLTTCSAANGAACIRVDCQGLGWLNEARWSGHVLGISCDRGVILQLTCDESWEHECLQAVPSEGIIRDQKGERCRHVTLIPMRNLRAAGKLGEDLRQKVFALPLPPVVFHPAAGTAERATGNSMFFALRGQRRWRHLSERIAATLGVEPPPQDHLFHMSIWNSQNGDPFRSVGDVRVEDFPYNLEKAACED